MFVQFESLPANSKIWIYQSERELIDSEVDFISSSLNDFILNWESHGSPVNGGFKIYYNRFIVIGADENSCSPSGCSIDKSVNTIKEIENQLTISLLDRSKVAYNQNGKIKTVAFNELSSLISNGIISQETKVFDNTITTLRDIESQWEKPASNTWISKYFNKK